MEGAASTVRCQSLLPVWELGSTEAQSGLVQAPPEEPDGHSTLLYTLLYSTLSVNMIYIKLHFQ